MSSPLLGLPGAAPPPEGSIDEDVAWHYGDPLGEQRSAEQGVGVVDRSNREVLTVSGPDRLTWLHTLTSQHFAELGDGEHTEALVLDLQGHPEQHVVVTQLDGTVWLDTEPGRAAGLLAYLEQMKFWSDVEITDVTDRRAVLTLLGPQSGELLTAVDGLDVVVRELDGRADLLVARESLETAWQRLVDAGASPAGMWAHEALRVAALRARFGIDTDERTIPHEVGWIGPAVHLQKGCYRGQETIARVSNLGRPPRRMLLLHLDSPETLPATGDGLHDGQRTVGRVGTVATHHELGPIALGLVKHKTDPATPLTAGDNATAKVDPESVPPDSGEPPGRAALRRLRS